jgi:hypothetical protein
MTEEELLTRVTQYEKTKSPNDLQKAIASLGEFLYTKFYQFKVNCANEDIKSEYITWMYPRLGRIIQKYDSGKASFRTYLHWVIRLSFRTFLRSWYIVEARERAFESEARTQILTQQGDVFDEDYGVFEVAEKKHCPWEEKNPDKDRPSHKQREMNARSIFLLACKTCVPVTDANVARIVGATGYREDYVRDTLETIERAHVGKREQLQRVCEKQNGYYIRARQCLVEMESLEKGTPRYQRVEREYRFCRKRWNDLRTSPRRRVRQPSNRFLSRVLGISRGTIDSTLARMLKDGYSQD